MTIPLKIWTKKPVSTFEGLKGLRLRVSGGLDIQTIEALGINAIAMPLPEVYPALEKGVIDGAPEGGTRRSMGDDRRHIKSAKRGIRESYRFLTSWSETAPLQSGELVV